MLSGDAGSPHVLRFGEKGQVWLELMAKGVSNHGAHVHLGKNAIEPLIVAIQRICELRNRSIAIPSAVLAAMTDARPVSEALSGAGEFETLRRLTVNIGVINGGQLVNIIPDRACARLDIRFPPGLTVAEVWDGSTTQLPMFTLLIMPCSRHLIQPLQTPPTSWRHWCSEMRELCAVPALSPTCVLECQMLASTGSMGFPQSCTGRHLTTWVASMSM